MSASAAGRFRRRAGMLFMETVNYHVPVMVNEVLNFLHPERGGIYVDCTLGGGGHTKEILKKLGPDSLMIGIDQDGDAIAESKERFRNGPVKILRGNFGDLGLLLEQEDIKCVDGCLFDLGVSSHQLDEADRGFSFRAEARLDMRMDLSSDDPAAYDLVNSLSAREMARIFREYGDERWAWQIAKRIERCRQEKPVETTLELARIIESSIPGKKRNRTLHPATRVFMALRIAVNRELQRLEEGLKEAIRVTRPGGRVVVISYHSAEDRIVKTIFREMAKASQFGDVTGPSDRRLAVLTKKPLIPSEEEVSDNPRARSAKLRAAEVLC